MPINLQQYREETGVFYNCSSKYRFLQYSYKFNKISMCLPLRIFSCLVFYVAIFIKALKKSTGSILRRFHFLFMFYDFLFSFSTVVDIVSPYQLKWWYGTKPKQDINQYFSVCHWNLNSVKSRNSSKVRSLIAYKYIRKFDITCLSESYLNP